MTIINCKSDFPFVFSLTMQKRIVIEVMWCCLCIRFLFEQYVFVPFMFQRGSEVWEICQMSDSVFVFFKLIRPHFLLVGLHYPPV